MESSEKEMLVILVEFFEMHGVSVLENVVAVLVVVSVLICSIKTLASNRRATAIVSTSWITWFLYRMVLDYKVAIEEVTRLAMDTFVSTQICVHSFAIMVVSWMALIAPFACDSYLLGHKIYTSLTMIQRVAIVVVVFIVYGCFKTYTTVVSNADKVKQIMFHISFVLVAPIIWYTILYIPSEWTGSLSDLVLTWIPFGVSCNLFYKCAKIRSRSSSSRGIGSSSGARNNSKKTYLTKLREIYSNTPKKISSKTSYSLKRSQKRIGHPLAYWSCWPMLVMFLYVCQGVDEGLEDPVLRTEPLLVIFTVYCFNWNASVFYAILSPISAAFTLTIDTVTRSVWNRTLAVRKLWVLKWFFSLTTWIMSSKIALFSFGSVMLLVGLRMMFATFSVIGTTLKLAIVIGAAADAFRVADLQLLDMYEQKLSFWILLQILEICTSMPFIGIFVRLWEPLLLAVSLVVGADVLRFSLSCSESLGFRLWQMVQKKEQKKKRNSTVVSNSKSNVTMTTSSAVTISTTKRKNVNKINDDDCEEKTSNSRSGDVSRNNRSIPDKTTENKKTR